MILRLSVLAILLAIFVLSDAKKSRMCDRFPGGTRNPPRPGDNGYEIRITEVGKYRSIKRFKPGATYEIKIASRYPSESLSNFYLTAMVDKMSGKKMMKKNSETSAGNFVHIANPPRTTNMKMCPGVVKSTYRGPMSSVKLLWTAPDFAQECIMFKATVEKSYPGVYFKDAGRLTKSICPVYSYASDEAISERMMPSAKECCACGTATYKMTFQGKWIRQLHPRDWPKTASAIHWSNIIGATHNKEYMIYYFGGMAKPGVRSACQLGDSSVLEGEFKREAGSNILNVIKARGMWEERNVGESRTAIFAVNRTHHLMSMLSMMGPSPDWCTGISAEDLCMNNCTWAKSMNISLYPWDAGVKKGNTYVPNTYEDELPRKPIREITQHWPPGNPFFVEPDGRLRPVAIVNIERLSPKKDYQCSRKPSGKVKTVQLVQDDSQQYGRRGKGFKAMDRTKELPPSLQRMIPTMCFMSIWSSWTPCSMTCGSGTMMRTRRIVRNLKPPLCKYVNLKQTKSCFGITRTCDLSKPCDTVNWSNWGPCNATCNAHGVQMRTREFVRREEIEVCSNKKKTMETKTCTLRCDDSIICSAAMIEGYRCLAPVKRYYYNMKKKQCLPFMYKGCKGSKNLFRKKKACHDRCDNAFNSLAKWQYNQAAQLQEDNTRKAMLKSKGKSMISCKKRMDEGHLCRRRKKRRGFGRPETRWYFDMKMKKCKEMKYNGCSGNDNNFLSLEDCSSTCRKYMNSRVFGPPQSCQVGNWGPWGPCDVECGEGQRRRKRRVKVAPRNGGRPCPPIFQFAMCKQRNCKPCKYTAWSGWSTCTTTCGAGVMERTRQRLDKENTNCTPDQRQFTDRVNCNNKPCPLNFFLHRKQ